MDSSVLFLFHNLLRCLGLFLISLMMPKIKVIYIFVNENEIGCDYESMSSQKYTETIEKKCQFF